VAALQSPLPIQHLIVRTAGEPQSWIPAIRREWDKLAPREPLFDFWTGDEILRSALAPQRLTAALVGAFGLIAISLAAIGIYSVVAYSVERRTREIGIRLAIGASPAKVYREVLFGTLALTMAGVALGSAISVGLLPFLAFVAKGIALRDPLTFLAVALLVAGISVVAALKPAFRAARIDPSAALRWE
jgi:ABC-type antimicrobial peptide transport system permease subunit